MNLFNFLAQAHQHDAATESFFEHVWHVSDWWPHYIELINDPSHVALELTLMLIFDGLIFGLIWRALRKYIQSHHSKDVAELIEAEHDYHDHEDQIDSVEARVQHLEDLMKKWQIYIDKEKMRT